MLYVYTEATTQDSNQGPSDHESHTGSHTPCMSPPSEVPVDEKEYNKLTRTI